MNTHEASLQQIEAWTDLGHALWPDHDRSEIRAEAKRILESTDQTCFLAGDAEGEVVGFIECAIHRGAEGPYVHIEGWYVKPEYRRQGIGRELMSEVEQWSLHRSIRILTSDTESKYPLSPAAHARSGFRPLHQLTIFIRELE
jgi:aminoglycoside 6'-N-acetyltransferase I